MVLSSVLTQGSRLFRPSAVGTASRSALGNRQAQHFNRTRPVVGLYRNFWDWRGAGKGGEDGSAKGAGGGGAGTRRKDGKKKPGSTASESLKKVQTYYYCSCSCSVSKKSPLTNHTKVVVSLLSGRAVVSPDIKSGCCARDGCCACARDTMMKLWLYILTTVRVTPRLSPASILLVYKIH